MEKLPQHKVSKFSDVAIHLRIFTPDEECQEPVMYMHQDDYYVFGFVESGECEVLIDFQSYKIQAGSVVLIQPGQVHCFVNSLGLSAYLLLIDGAFIEDKVRQVIAQYSFTSQIALLASVHQAELKQLFSMLSAKKRAITDALSASLVMHLSLAVVDVIASTMQYGLTQRKCSRRYVELTQIFRSLLKENVTTKHAPAFYANKMNVSVIYLNEAVKAATGNSVTQNIHHEIIVRARRELVYTNKSVKEIAVGLGFEDYAYFTRIFTRITGQSPNLFRKNHQ